VSTIPIPFDLLEELTKHLVTKDGSIEASMLAGRLIAAKVAVDPTVAQIAEQPEGQRAWDVTGWSAESVAGLVLEQRKGVEPAKLHIKIRDDLGEEVEGIGDGDSCYDGETPFVALVIGYDPPPRVVEFKRVVPQLGLNEKEDPNFNHDVLDLPDPEQIWGTPDPNTEQS